MTRQILLLLFFSLASLTHNFGQISSARLTMSQGVADALILSLPNLSEKKAVSLWSSFIKDYGSSAKKVKKSSEYLANNADIAALGRGQTVDIYTLVESETSGSTLKMWVDLGDTFLNPVEHPDRFIEAEKILMSFALYAAREEVREEMAGEEKELESLERDLKKLESDNERYHREIERAKEAIRKAEEAIARNEQEQVEMRNRIKEQKDAVEQVSRRLQDL